MNQTQKKFFASLLNDLKPDYPPLTDEHRKPLTIWMPVEYYAKYEKIQKGYRRGYTQKLRELIMMALDNTPEPNE